MQARIDRLQRVGVLASHRPQISSPAMGFAGLAYVHLQLAQGMLDETSRRLAEIPKVLEANATTGESDLLCRIVARDNADLETVLQRVIAVPGVIRSRTEVVLSRRIEPRPPAHREAGERPGLTLSWEFAADFLRGSPGQPER